MSESQTKTTTKKTTKKTRSRSNKSASLVLNVEYLENWHKYVLTNNNDAKINPAKHGDAGLDLYYAGPRITIAGGQSKLLHTGVKFELPSGHYGKIFDRSSIASRTPFLTRGGVIDNGYRGEVKIIIHNLEINPTPIEPGTKIAQMVVMPTPKLEIKAVDAVGETDRGDSGFGSTGK